MALFIYLSDEIDALLIYIPQTDKLYWLDAEVFHGRSTLQLRYAPARNGQTINCLLAESYLW